MIGELKYKNSLSDLGRVPFERLFRRHYRPCSRNQDRLQAQRGQHPVLRMRNAWIRKNILKSHSRCWGTSIHRWILLGRDFWFIHLINLHPSNRFLYIVSSTYHVGWLSGLTYRSDQNRDRLTRPCQLSCYFECFPLR